MAKSKIQKIREDLVAAVQAAMARHGDLTPDHDKYEEWLPDLIERTDGYTVDEVELRKFRSVLYFMLCTTFGVDGSDGKGMSNVQFNLVDRQRYIPMHCADWRIPYAHKLKTPGEWAEALRNAEGSFSCAQSELQDITRSIHYDLETRQAHLDRRRKAKGCTNERCGKGWEKITQEEYRAEFDRGATRYEKHVMRKMEKPMGFYRLCPHVPGPRRGRGAPA